MYLLYYVKPLHMQNTWPNNVNVIPPRYMIYIKIYIKIGIKGLAEMYLKWYFSI